MALTQIWGRLTADRSNNATRRLFDPPNWLAWGAVGFAVVVWVIVVWGSVGPYFANDEVSGLVYGSVLVSPDYHWEIGGSSYLPGMAILYAPLWLLFEDPAAIARGASVIVGVLGILAMWPLTRLAQMLGLTRNASLIIAAMTVVAPGRALYGNYYWGETLLALGVVLMALTGLRMAREMTTTRAVQFALASAVTLSAHGRALPLVAVGGIALLALARRNVRVAAIGAVTYAAACGAVLALYAYVSQVNRWDLRGSVTTNGFVPDIWTDMFPAISSQAFYFMVSWSVLVLFGAVFLWRRAHVGSDRTWAWWMIGGFGLAGILLLIQVSSPPGHRLRLDAFVYGRYLEGFLFLVAFLGFVLVVEGVSRRLTLGAAAASLATGVAFVLIVVPTIPTGGWFEPGHMPGLFLWLDDDNLASDNADPWTAITLIGVLIGVAAAFASRIRAVFLLLAAVAFAAYTLYADLAYIATAEDPNRHRPPYAGVVVSLPEGEPLSAISTLSDIGLANNLYAYWLYPHEWRLYNPDRNERPTDMVLAWVDWDVAQEEGALPLNGSRVIPDVWVWVFPGELFDELDAQGRLAHPVGE